MRMITGSGHDACMDLSLSLSLSRSPPSATELRIRSLLCASISDALSSEGIRTETGRVPNSHISCLGCSCMSPSV